MISIIIATFNDQWIEDHKERIERAADSARRQTNDDVEIIRIHAETLQDARNLGAVKARGSRLVFLDADDWLDLDFCDKIKEPQDILQPKTAFFTNGTITSEPHWIDARADLLEGNHLIIGCPVNRQLFLDVGGFDDYPIYEDWALWLKMRKAGATFGRCEGIYNIDIRQDGRNNGPVNEIYDEIRSQYA